MPAAATLRSTGPDGSSIGEKLAPDQEGLLIAEIDLGLIGIAKNAADPRRALFAAGCHAAASQ